MRYELTDREWAAIKPMAAACACMKVFLPLVVDLFVEAQDGPNAEERSHPHTPSAKGERPS